MTEATPDEIKKIIAALDQVRAAILALHVSSTSEAAVKELAQKLYFETHTGRA